MVSTALLSAALPAGAYGAACYDTSSAGAIGRGSSATAHDPAGPIGGPIMSDIIYDFGSGRSDPGTFPTRALQRAAVTAIENEAATLTDYPGGLGYPGLRQAMAA